MLKKKSLILVLAITVLMAFVLSACGQDGSSAGVKNSDISKPEDLAGKKIGLQINTTADESATEYLKTIHFEVKRYDQVIMPFSDLKAGRIDAVMVDGVVGKYYVTLEPENYKIAVDKLTNEPIGIAFKKGNEALRDKVDDIIVELRNDGSLKGMSEKWFGDDLTSGVDGAATEVSNKGSIPEGMKVLRVGVDDSYPPMEFRDEKNNLVGFDVDLAKAIGEKLGMEVEFVSTAWDGIFPSLNTDKFDCIISSVSANEDRQANFAMTKPYVANAQVIVVAPEKK